MQIAGYTFTDPVTLGDGADADGAGVYVILCPTKDGKYIVVYVGQTKDAAERVDSGHHKWKCFHDECETPYFAFHSMPGSSKAEREGVEQHLIDKYSPPCNG